MELLSLCAAYFPDSEKARKGLTVLKQLDEEGKVELVAFALASVGNGRLNIEESETPGARGAVLGGIVGGLVGMVGGPAVAAMGAAAGAISGGWFDVNRIDERDEFARRVAARINQGDCAVLAQMVSPDEMAKETIREKLAALGGTIVQ